MEESQNIGKPRPGKGFQLLRRGREGTVNRGPEGRQGARMKKTRQGNARAGGLSK